MLANLGKLIAASRQQNDFCSFLRPSPHLEREPKNRPYRKKENGQEKETNRDVFSEKPRPLAEHCCKAGSEESQESKKYFREETESQMRELLLRS
jgi:hypothetical protein